MNSINTTYCQPANLIPHFWNYKIVDKDGRPDLPCILLLSEVFGWFRSLSSSRTYYSTGKSSPELVDGSLAISYDFLSQKLNFHKERIRKNFVKLGKLEILTREVRNIALDDGSRINQLYISIDREFFESCFRTPEFDIRVEDNNSPSDSLAFTPSHLVDGEHISKKNKKNKDRSIESSVFKGLAQEKLDLASFYPIAQSDIEYLQESSGREFTGVATNEILLKLSKKYQSHSFPNKAAFLSYMTKILHYEMRDAVQISSIDFKLNCNKDHKEIAKQRYLEQIEYSRDISLIAQLRRKLASVLEQNTAYELLKSATFKSVVANTDNIFTISLSHQVELSSLQQQLVLDQVRAVCGGHISSLEMLQPNTDNSVQAECLDVLPVSKPVTEDLQPIGATEIWSQVRSMLISHHGDDGKAIDQNWFSKLSPEIDTDNRNITLKAPSSFMKDWIQTKYSLLLERFCQSQNYNLVGVV